MNKNKPQQNNIIKIHKTNLPLKCPSKQLAVQNWSYHPTVFLDIEDSKNNTIICPYCSTVYQLVE